MKELETILNSLIKRGWKPWWIDSDTIYVHSTRDGKIILECPYLTKSYRDLISLESGLWQFVCKNKLHKKTDNFWENVHKTSTNIWWFPHNHQYRLLESALIPEEGLAQFLVDNIKL